MAVPGGAGPVLLWSAGEASGDRHAARVASEIRARRPDVRMIGLGGPDMAGAGVELLADMEQVSVVGLVEVLGRWREILRVRRRLLRRLAGSRSEPPPSLFIPVDFPGLNLRLARRAHALGVPVVYFISPQLWAWGMGRLGLIRRVVRRMLVLFDFEAELFARAGVPVTHVGHPLVEQVAQVPAREAARATHGLGPADLALVLQPGSRRGEVARLAAPMLQVAATLRRELPALRVFVRLAPGLDPAPITRAAASAGTPVELVSAGDAAIVRAADLALVAAGTATLETALLDTPMLIVYRVTPLTYAIARRLVRIESIGLVNVVAGRRIVPEFVQRDFTVARVAAAARALLGDPAARAAQRAEFRALRPRLGAEGAAARAAGAILAELDRVAGEAGR
jgi:lipid-A-disaccharide synthase